MDPKQREKNKIFLEGFDSLIFALLALLLIFAFIARTGKVDGTSMDATLLDGDQVLVYSFFYTPSRGDIVMVDSYISYGKPLVKRVIAVGGDTVEINSDGEVYVNGQLLDEPYISSDTILYDDEVVFPVTVPEGQVFVMGDNRSDSKDSRSADIGMIDKREILGKVVFRFFPTSGFGAVE